MKGNMMEIKKYLNVTVSRNALVIGQRKRVKTGCGSHTQFGHGENAICGEVFYHDTFECQTCQIKRLELNERERE